MRITVLVSHLMMASVNCFPASWAILQGRRPSPGQDSSQPPRRNKSTRRDHAVLADADRKSSYEIETEEERQIDWPRPEAKREQANGVEHNNKKAVGPVKTRIFR